LTDTNLKQGLTRSTSETKNYDRKRIEKINKYREMAEIDDGPGRSRGAAEDREHDEPGEKEDEDVCGPYAGVHEPLGVLVQIRWRDRLDIQLRHGWGRLFAVWDFLYSRAADSGVDLVAKGRFKRGER
jgi:hypothetical protein